MTSGTSLGLVGANHSKKWLSGAPLSTESLSLDPSLNVTQAHSGNEAHFRTGVGSTSAWSGDFMQAALVPGYSHEVGENLIHLCGELSWDVTPRWTPYSRVAWEATEGREFSSELTTGIRWGGAHLDVLLERSLYGDQVWKAGVNWRWDQNIEMNVEGALPPDEHSWGVVVIFQPGGR